MMPRILFYLLGYTFLVFWVENCARPPVEPVQADYDDLQIRLGRAMDSLDRATCGAPPGCSCHGDTLSCPNPEPPRAP